MELGQKLKEARTRAGLKQEELAQKLGVSRQTISNWENGRSLPDIGSTIKLSGIYQMSLDELLKDGDEVLKVFEDIAAKRRKFWQMMLEIGVILELLGVILAGMEFVTAAYIFTIPGIILVYIAIIMHLRVFDHDRGELFRGILGICILLSCQILLLMDFVWPSTLLRSVILLAAHLLIWSAGVWTIDWKSTRLWLIIVLFIGVYTLPMGFALQKSGSLNQATPLGGEYQIEEVLYPEAMEAPEYTKIRLSNLMYIEDRYGNSTNMGQLHYVAPTEGQAQKGIWQLIPEDNPDALYKVTVEADDRILLAYYEQEQLQWKWLLSDYGRDTCSITVPTFGHTMYMSPEWYAPGRADPEPYLKSSDIVGKGTLNIVVGGLETDTLTLYEEYHHGENTENASYTLEPNKPYSYSLELKTRYDGKEEWALYRIPYADGEYRFILTFG